MKAVFGVVVDGAIMMIAFAAAIALRFDFQAPRWGWAATWQSFLTVAFVQLAMMIAFDCLRRWRLRARDLMRFMLAFGR